MDWLIVFAASYLYLVALFIGGIYFFTRRKAVMKGMAICGAVIAPLAYVIAKVSSRFFYDPRPFVVGHFAPLIAHAADNGFPSDHTLLTAAVAMIVWFYDRKWSGVLWVLAILVGWARVAAGIHHWTDIFGSIAIVLIAGAVYGSTVGRSRRAD